MIYNFLFHRVNPIRDVYWDPMDVKLFEKCVRYISSHFKVVTIEEIALSDDRFTNANYATITFDDGYKDNIDYAASVLDDFKCKASFYVVTSCIEHNIPTWTKRLDSTIKHSNKKRISLSFGFIPESLRNNHINTEREKVVLLSRLKAIIKQLSHENRKTILDYIFTTYYEKEPLPVMMNWQDLSELKSYGHQIGSHTESHFMLGTMSDENEIRQELEGSAKLIHDRLGHHPIAISYPVGSYTATVIKMSKTAGYKLGLAVQQRIYNPLSDNEFEIPRIELYNESWFKTRLRITNKLEKIKKTIGY